MDTPTPANFGWPDFTKDIANLRNDISSLHMFGIAVDVWLDVLSNLRL